MEAMYPYFLIIHILCAIVFLGFIFTDVVLLTPLKKWLDKDIADKVFSIISQRGVKIMPICVLMLVISGGAMISRYIGGDNGYFENTLQIALVVKMLLALCIVVMVVISLSCKFLKLKNPLANVIHPIALCLGLFIVILAKVAFFV